MKIKRSELIQLANKYIGNDSLEAQNQIMLKIATARCARISYTTLGDNPKIDYEADIKLHDRLLESKHASPFEHIAKCPKCSTLETYISETDDGITHCNKDLNLWSGNFKGWIQYRQLLQ